MWLRRRRRGSGRCGCCCRAIRRTRRIPMPRKAFRPRSTCSVPAIARRRGLKFTWEKTQNDGAVACAPALSARLEASVQAVQSRSIALVSGAGHDAVVVSAVAPVAMLFVRCRAGLSHHPDEYAAPADIGVALDVLVHFLMRLNQPVASSSQGKSSR